MRLIRRFLLILSLPGFLLFSSFLVSSTGLRTANADGKTRVALTPCNFPGVDGQALCGSYEVYEDRAARAGRKIALNVVVLRALNGESKPDPVFWFHGGPGAAATDTIPAARFGFLGNLRKDRDLVFVDQRGTGKSNPLKCDIGDDPSDLQSFFGELLPREKIRECRRELEKIANLKLYTTPIAMDDLDEVRAALGYDKINLAGASYGSIAAQVYLRQHPDHVRSVLLAGVATPGIKQPLLFPRAAQHSLDRLFEDCSADENCRRPYPDLKKEFEAVLSRFDKGPIAVAMISPTSKEKQNVSLGRGNFVEHLRLLLYTAPGASFVPIVVHNAFQNDYLPFEAAAIRFSPGRIVSRGMYMTVTCSEGVPFISEQDIASETKGTFVGDYRVRAHIDACKEWPRGEIPRSYIDLVRSDIPLLMISGDLDGSTPYWLGEEALKYLPNGRRVLIRYYGHQMDGACVASIAAEFVNKGSAKELDTKCTEKIRRPPFITELPAGFGLQ